MAALYRKHVLKEPEAPTGLVQILPPAPAAAPAKQEKEVQEEVGSFGD